MGLSQTRKILSVIIAALVAVATLALILSFVIGNTVTSIAFLDRVMIRGELVSACEEQLDLKYTALEAETGIPKRVFDRAKSDYKVEDSLKSELSKVFNNEEPTPYSETMVDYFTKLCTEFLDGSEIKYDEENIKQTARKAAQIYNDTVGFHNTENATERLSTLKNRCSKAMLVSVMLIFIGLLMLMIIYAEKKKGVTYALSGVAGGAAGAMLTAITCSVFKVWNKIVVYPDAFGGAVRKAVNICTMLTVPAGAVICIGSCIAIFIIIRKLEKKNERAIVV